MCIHWYQRVFYSHWAIDDQPKLGTQQPVPMMSERSAHLTSLPIGFRTWLWRYACLLLFILMLWHRQAIFESKRDKFSYFVECTIRSWEVSDTNSPADWMPTHKPPELLRMKQNLNSIACPYDKRTFSPIDFTAGWLSHLALAVYMFVAKHTYVRT